MSCLHRPKSVIRSSFIKFVINNQTENCNCFLLTFSNYPLKTSYYILLESCLLVSSVFFQVHYHICTSKLDQNHLIRFCVFGPKSDLSPRPDLQRIRVKPRRWISSSSSTAPGASDPKTTTRSRPSSSTCCNFSTLAPMPLAWGCCSMAAWSSLSSLSTPTPPKLRWRRL